MLRYKVEKYRKIAAYSNFRTLRLCVFKTLLLLFSLLFVSCSPQKRLAYSFVEKSNGASVAFYVPNELKKMNIRKDCQQNYLEGIATEDMQDTIDARTKIVNKIDDDVFLNVLISSFESTLKDYNISLRYWEDENTKPDSLHWIVDLSHIEIQEFNEYLCSRCGIEGNYEFFPSTTVNVASWIELVNGDNDEMLFTEQNYGEYVIDCDYYLDSAGKWMPYADIQSLTIEGFYDFTVALGKLYAGYCYDFFMNEYVRKEMMKKGKEYSDDEYLRYDPYESYIYYTRKDRLIEL